MKRMILIAAGLALTACNPKLYSPQVDVPAQYLHAEATPQDTLGIALDWWRAFGDPVLDGLIDTALVYNRDLEAAASRVEQARYNLGVARAQFLPSVGLGVSAEGDYTAETGIVQKYAIEPSLSWEISLFGALRNTKRSAKAAILASKWAERGVMLSVAAEVATTYFTYRQYERSLEIARRSYALRQESAALIDSMFRYGMSDGVALEQARSLVYTAAADIPSYERAVEQTRLSLNTLLGKSPDYPAPDSAYVGPHLLDIPAGLPSDLLDRRPDVMQSYYAMRQAAAGVGIARAARYPSIILTGAGGVAGITLKALTSGDPWAWTAAASLTQPIFAFGKLKRQEQAAREQYNQSLYAYEQSVLTALADVESVLTGISTYREQIGEQEDLLNANSRISLMTNALYKSGLSGYLDVIDAERSLYQTQLQQVGLTAQQYINYVSLCKALGGGW